MVVVVGDVDVDVDAVDSEEVVVRRVLGFAVEAVCCGVTTDWLCTGAAGVTITDCDGIVAGAAAAGAGAAAAGDGVEGAEGAGVVRRGIACRRTRSTRRWWEALCARRAGAAVLTVGVGKEIGVAAIAGAAGRRAGRAWHAVPRGGGRQRRLAAARAGREAGPRAGEDDESGQHHSERDRQCAQREGRSGPERELLPDARGGGSKS